MTVEAIFTEALALPPDQRALLVARLRESLSIPLPPLGPVSEWPKGVPIYGRGKDSFAYYVDDDSHLADFAEYME